MATTDRARESRETHTLMEQRGSALGYAAQGTPLNSAPSERACLPPTGAGLVATDAKGLAKVMANAPQPNTCQQRLTLNFFFDGTGNNIDADASTMQHSNVARLFIGRQDDNPNAGLHSFYIYGLGTYFKEIDDPGNTTRGKGMGAHGQDRLDWAMRKFDEALARAEARAMNPTNKVLGIRVNVFGFSRGATLARAFVRDLAARCTPGEAGYRWAKGQYPIEVGFLGLFDTVASVGLPMSANNTPAAASAGLYAVGTTLNLRAQSVNCGLRAVAFGEPGADPAPGSYDGHASWADGLRVLAPVFVKRCVHMVAGHEIRNSFPVDSTLDGTHYPSGTTEMVYPGAHSDVGGGYQPGEGARSAHPAEMLSLVPLRAMHAMAIEAGVPLRSLSSLQSAGTDMQQRSFALDPEGAARYKEMVAHYRHYMAQAGSGGRSVGAELLAHMHWFNRWRMFNIRRNQQAAQRGLAGPDAATATARERGYAAERARLDRELEPLEAEHLAAQTRLERAQQRLQAAKLNRARLGIPVPAETAQAEAAAREEASRAQDNYLKVKAQRDTLADDSTLPANLAAYDARLLQDAQELIRLKRENPKLKLRPHYANLVSAYEDEFVRGAGLRDEKVIAFFDRYVHDSLAGFALDSTLPSDPRVVYAGGDNKLKFAAVGDLGHQAAA